jgi:hypothetical protein
VLCTLMSFKPVSNFDECFVLPAQEQKLKRNNG